MRLYVIDVVCPLSDLTERQTPRHQREDHNITSAGKHSTHLEHHNDVLQLNRSEVIATLWCNLYNHINNALTCRLKQYNFSIQIAYMSLLPVTIYYTTECLKRNNFSISDFAVFNDHPPELHELCDAAAEIADLYDQIGMGLGLTRGRLRIIRADTAGRPNQMQLCFTEVFSYWRNGRTLPYTWETFASVLLHPWLAPETKLLLKDLHKNLSLQYLLRKKM